MKETISSQKRTPCSKQQKGCPDQIQQDGTTGEATVIFLGQRFTEEEYRAAAANLSGFFSLLRDWAEREKQGEKKPGQ